MKYKDVLYPPIIDTLTRLKIEIDRRLAVKEDDSLTELFLKIDTLIAKINDTFSGALGDPCLIEVHDFISETDVENSLKAVEPLLFNKLRVILGISIILEDDENLDLDGEIIFPVANFKIVEDEGSELPFNAFGYFNANSSLDSLAFFRFKDKWVEEILNSKFNHALLATSLYNLNLSVDTFDKPYILTRSDASNKLAIQAALRLQVVAHGIKIHTEIESKIKPSLYASSNISAIKAYQQFDESISILSEFNAHTDILNRFLSLYHVIEGFMYRVPIAKLGSNNGGKMFSVRDFRQLYDSVDRNEIDAIKDIFKNFWSLKIDGKFFNKIVMDALRDLPNIPDFSKIEFNLLLGKLGIFSPKKTGFEYLLNDQAGTIYAALVYKVRCAIVHNSETEFHISHFTLSKTMVLILDNLLIRPLEMAIFNQIADSSSIVWYTGPSLNLYEA
ncbi:hypothetical protein [Herbaspirillum lusitanum]|uniref:hypothetical protein n=1 Tax=Herbaspirillum lusitanum TaxID=213312 RepID=UPI0002FAA4AC|nr:hypothetical protein [Herbaspirillum lusitanum]